MKSAILADAQRSRGLASALSSSGATVAAKPVAAAEEAAPASPVAAKTAPRAKPAPAPSRAGTKSFTVHLPEAVRRQVKMMAVEQSRTMDDLVSEGLNLLFAKHRKPEIAPQKSAKPS